MTKEILEVGLRTPTALNIHIRKVLAVTMASKIRYYKCVDCNSMINDESMIYDEGSEWRQVVEFCYGCMQYNPEVVLAWA